MGLLRPALPRAPSWVRPLKRRHRAWCSGGWRRTPRRGSSPPTGFERSCWPMQPRPFAIPSARAGQAPFSISGRCGPGPSSPPTSHPGSPDVRSAAGKFVDASPALGREPPKGPSHLNDRTAASQPLPDSRIRILTSKTSGHQALTSSRIRAAATTAGDSANRPCD